jgi:hypothetical protein
MLRLNTLIWITNRLVELATISQELVVFRHLLENRRVLRLHFTSSHSAFHHRTLFNSLNRKRSCSLSSRRIWSCLVISSSIVVFFVLRLTSSHSAFHHRTLVNSLNRRRGRARYCLAGSGSCFVLSSSIVISLF